MNKSKIRSSLMGTAVIISSVLLALMSGCGHDKTDTEFKAPPIVSTTTVTTTTANVVTSTTTTVNTETTTNNTTTTTTMSTIMPEVTTTDYDYVIEEPVEYAPITEYERILLSNLVANEYGSDYVPVSEKAKVVAVVVNRVYSPEFPNSIEEVLVQPEQFSGYYVSGYEWDIVTDSVREAVDYYFAHEYEFPNYLYFEGDGTWNWFY